MILLLATVAALLATGCKGPADSSAVTPHAYRTDLENTVVLAIRRGNTDEELLRQIGIVAKRHNLDDWASVDDTFTAIGTGLREAGAGDDQAEAVAQLVSGGDAARRQRVLEAYGG